MSEIIEAKAQRDIEIIDIDGVRVVLVQGVDYEVHMMPEGSKPSCGVYRLGGIELIALVDRRDIRELLAAGALM